MGGVNGPSDIVRVIEQGIEIEPLRAPVFADLRVLLTPTLGKFIECFKASSSVTD
jgi:hypothetical protein